MLTETSKGKLDRVLWAGYALFWLALAISPRDRKTWLLENVLVVLVLSGAFLLRRRLSLSHGNRWACWAFFMLHAIGSHFTYSHVPYQSWVSAFGIQTERNHYDRFAHFAAGLLVTGILRELLPQVLRMSPAAARWFALSLAMSLSMTYELIEWGAAAVFGGDAARGFLGMQGDIWDAQKDMALATLGACIAMLVSALRAWRAG